MLYAHILGMLACVTPLDVLQYAYTGGTPKSCEPMCVLTSGGPFPVAPQAPFLVALQARNLVWIAGLAVDCVWPQHAARHGSGIHLLHCRP